MQSSRLDREPGASSTSPVSELRGFARGLRKDWAAVAAGLTVPYSCGAVEGHVNRIILWNLSARVPRMRVADARVQSARRGACVHVTRGNENPAPRGTRSS